MNEFNERRPILILGIGNILLRDEGVGVRVIETLQQQKTPDTIDLVDGGTSGADLIDILADRRKVIIVDAVDAGKAPGTVIRFEEDDLENIPNSALSLHELGIAETLKMTRKLNCKPKEVVFFGIQPKDISPGLELSDEMGEIVPIVAEKALKEALVGAS